MQLAPLFLLHWAVNNSVQYAIPSMGMKLTVVEKEVEWLGN